MLQHFLVMIHIAYLNINFIVEREREREERRGERSGRRERRKRKIKEGDRAYLIPLYTSM